MLMQPETDEAGKPAEPTWAVVVPRTLATAAAGPDESSPVPAGHDEHAGRGLQGRVDLAVMWATLALQQPSLEPNARPPLGYSIRPDGAYQDALLTERALEALGALIDEGEPSLGSVTNGASMTNGTATSDGRAEAVLPSLYALRAELETGWGQFDRAAEDLRVAIALLEERSGEPDIDTWARELRHQLDATLDVDLPRLGRKGRKQLDEAVERMSRSFAGAFSPTPPELLLFEHDALPVPLHPRVREADGQIRAIGLKHLAWVEDLAHGRSTGRRSMVGAWHDAGGTTVFVAMAAPGSWRNSATTLLS
ncbi:MAG: hypothetical protein Q7T55_07125, partial [Solirubrobacteraceae bacterium]|nr:hypothetical protein [Solirubrobacteraceae bacterium]